MTVQFQWCLEGEACKYTLVLIMHLAHDHCDIGAFSDGGSTASSCLAHLLTETVRQSGPNAQADGTPFVLAL